MGLSFHDELSLVEAVSSLRFEAADLNPIPGTGPHNLNAIPEMISIEERRDDDFGGGDNIQIVYRWTYKVDRQPSSDEILQINA